jgi:hypothetical protein
VNSQVSIRCVEAHDQAGEEFANALKKSFPSIAAEITPQAVISFHGTLRGRDVVCSFEQITEEKGVHGPVFSRHYDPTAPEIRDRRKRLFALIEAGRSEESAGAARELFDAYSGVDRVS